MTPTLHQSQRRAQPLRAAALASLVGALASTAALAADSHVSTLLPANNFGGLPTLNVGGGSTALLRFDLAPLPAGTTAAKLVKATLVLSVNRVGTAGAVELQTVNAAWAEAGVTANTALPTAGPGSGPVLAVPTAGQSLAVDVTAQVKSWITNPATNNGWTLAPTLAAPGTVVFFDSKENTATGHVARLNLTLADQGPAGPQGVPGSNGTNGTNGKTGTTGANGANGINGSNGTNGLPGLPGAMGQQGPQGQQGVQGAQGPSGVLGISSFQGTTAAAVALVNTNYVFVGPSATIVTKAGQRVTASGVFSIGSEVSALLRVDMCSRPSATPAANPTIIRAAFKVVQLKANVRTLYSPVTSYVPGAVSWHIGNCVAGKTAGAITLNQNDWSSGWVMVTN